MKNVFGILFLITFYFSSFAQTGKPIRGIILDVASNEKLPFASISIHSLNKSTMTDSSGHFCLENIPVGRHDIQVSFIGYESTLIREVMVSSGKEVFLEIPLKEKIHNLKEIIIQANINKEEPLNPMATVSARMLSVEEASRYAGGFDDPARLVSSFAGVSGNISSNGIAIRGNSPQFLQWRLEGVEIPNPTHFSDITGVGGGILTALSSHVLGNSDFFTGAFPAEYNNALSGVFDMQMRNGNSWKREHTFQLGTLGIDFASEGPFKKGKPGSYLFNYRYSSMALVGSILPDVLGEAAGMKYQDFSFKINLPTSQWGTFSIWGFGVVDHFAQNHQKDSSLWENEDDQISAIAIQKVAAGGIGHKFFLNNTTYIKTSLAGSYNQNDLSAHYQDENMNKQLITHMKGKNPSLVLSSYINSKVSSKLTNRTGININGLFYDLDYQISPSFPYPDHQLDTISLSKGSTLLTSVYSHTLYQLNEKWAANAGVNMQWFALNKEWTVEPRFGIKWQMITNQALGFAYGIHSRHEKIDYYFVQKDNRLVNKNLKLSKAHHFVFSYDWSISPNLHLKIEPYYQYLFDIPVENKGSYSIINETDWNVYKEMFSKGKGKNYGIDLTLERYLSGGYYYLVTASLFQSIYCGGDGVWHDTRLNRNFIINTLAGKEWLWGNEKQHMLSVNVRLTYQGGERHSPIDEVKSHLSKDVIYDESRAYAIQLDPAFISSFTISYTLNKRKLTHQFALKMINATFYEEFNGFSYNLRTNQIDKYTNSIAIPNISYTIQF